ALHGNPSLVSCSLSSIRSTPSNGVGARDAHGGCERPLVARKCLTRLNWFRCGPRRCDVRRSRRTEARVLPDAVGSFPTRISSISARAASEASGGDGRTPPLLLQLAECPGGGIFRHVRDARHELLDVLSDQPAGEVGVQELVVVHGHALAEK